MSEEKTCRFRAALELLQPAFLAGFTFPHWIRILHENRWEIDAQYLPRAAVATLGTIATSCLKPFEPTAELDEYCEKLWRRPLFILGLPRSGTTHLFNLLARDPQFAYPTRLECYNPHTFLLLRRLGLHRVLGMVREKKRFMDNVKTSWLSPEEDTIALSVLSGGGSRLIGVFTRNSNYRMFFGPAGQMRESHIQQFCDSLSAFSKKLVFLHRARPLFKSPMHTRHIAEILEIFPDATFLTILRNPFSQFASLKAMHHSASRGWSALQKRGPISDEERLKWVSSMLQCYLDTRSLIPRGRLCEIHYDDLVRDQEACLRKVYSALDLGQPPSPGNAEAEKSYRKNSHPELCHALKAKIRAAYRPFVEAGLFDPAQFS
jgi:hypothetical protein